MLRPAAPRRIAPLNADVRHRSEVPRMRRRIKAACEAEAAGLFLLRRILQDKLECGLRSGLCSVASHPGADVRGVAEVHIHHWRCNFFGRHSRHRYSVDEDSQGMNVRMMQLSLCLATTALYGPPRMPNPTLERTPRATGPRGVHVHSTPRDPASGGAAQHGS